MTLEHVLLFGFLLLALIVCLVVCSPDPRIQYLKRRQKEGATSEELAHLAETMDLG